jgi:hypothetical protein
MSRSLRDLAELEEQLARELPVPEVTSRTTAERATFAQSSEVHVAYVEIASGDGPDALEALKRAAFLQWFIMVEPPVLSGVSALEPGAEAGVLALLDDRCRRDALDRELGQMLAWYYRVGGFYFDARPSALLDWLRAHPSAETPMLEPSSMELRGSMGRYWRSVVESERTRQR